MLLKSHEVDYIRRNSRPSFWKSICISDHPQPLRKQKFNIILQADLRVKIENERGTPFQDKDRPDFIECPYEVKIHPQTCDVYVWRFC
jgi:hypothetical protein